LANKKELIQSLKINTDSNFFNNLKHYLELRLAELQSELMKCEDRDFKRVQGRALETEEFLKSLNRRKLAEQQSGAYGS